MKRLSAKRKSTLKSIDLRAVDLRNLPALTIDELRKQLPSEEFKNAQKENVESILESLVQEKHGRSKDESP